jgi:gas vesicle protein
VGSVTHGVLQSAHNTKEAAQEGRRTRLPAGCARKGAAQVEGLSATQEKLRKKLEKKLHKEAKQGSKAVHEKVDNTRDTVQVLRHRAGGKRDDILAEVQIADSTSKWLWIAIGVLAGVLLGILLAPTTGRRSRALIKDKVNKAGHEAADLGHNAKAKATDIANRAAGKIHEIKAGAEEDLADDRTVADRVRTAIGESPITRNMERLNIDCVNGIVTVRGPHCRHRIAGTDRRHRARRQRCRRCAVVSVDRRNRGLARSFCGLKPV